MSKNLDIIGLKSIANQYDLFFIDLWGVMHNGIQLYDHSIEVLEKLMDLKKEFVLLTNAPRPNSNVVNFLNKMGLEKTFFSKLSKIVTRLTLDLLLGPSRLLAGPDSTSAPPGRGRRPCINRITILESFENIDF